ncbi:hypothetical protein M427DRAFT_495276 [Gonapodya prolifera JEL478]|uniref:RGS domain-containing protein n=1 Tax=Gonapodya prolifera (strain JEL478) TaxID=1344416 RepID=A0A138ZWD3_GONPJ|nr:hypothetical protein M427DRAFT_495276 [Gonapodya prolifera JEL478]|eukprot:KXS08822.1 hypothetical protein M427DRAFT_495276 [Gonapodya prolifera JEL478]
MNSAVSTLRLVCSWGSLGLIVYQHVTEWATAFNLRDVLKGEGLLDAEDVLANPNLEMYALVIAAFDLALYLGLAWLFQSAIRNFFLEKPEGRTSTPTLSTLLQHPLAISIRQSVMNGYLNPIIGPITDFAVPILKYVYVGTTSALSVTLSHALGLFNIPVSVVQGMYEIGTASLLSLMDFFVNLPLEIYAISILVLIAGAGGRYLRDLRFQKEVSQLAEGIRAEMRVTLGRMDGMVPFDPETAVRVHLVLDRERYVDGYSNQHGKYVIRDQRTIDAIVKRCKEFFTEANGFTAEYYSVGGKSHRFYTHQPRLRPPSRVRGLDPAEILVFDTADQVLKPYRDHRAYFEGIDVSFLKDSNFSGKYLESVTKDYRESYVEKKRENPNGFNVKDFQKEFIKTLPQSVMERFI